MTFRLDCVPPTTSHHAKRIVTIGGHARLADRSELLEARRLLAALAIPFRPLVPLRGPIVLGAVFEWPWTGDHSKATRAGGRLPKITRPDCSNVIKTLEDVLVSLQFLEDDNAVAVLHVEKWWSDRPGITVTLSPLTPTDCLDEGAPDAKTFTAHGAITHMRLPGRRESDHRERR